MHVPQLADDALADGFFFCCICFAFCNNFYKNGICCFLYYLRLFDGMQAVEHTVKTHHLPAIFSNNNIFYATKNFLHNRHVPAA